MTQMVIMGKRVLSMLAFLTLLSAHQSYAQIQQGYADESPTPDVQVDRSVLEDLKGYQPPPMFATQPSDTVVIPDAPALQAAPLPTPVLTTPKAEDILSHPIENHHVLTEQHPQLTAPVAPAVTQPVDEPLLPIPEDKPNPKKDNKKEVVKKSEPKKESKKETVKPVVKTPEKSPEKSSEKKSAYHPQTPKTMPAVPSIKVEKNELPPIHSSALPDLPPTTDNMMEHRKATIGERMMDAALERHIEKDDEKIKETLQKTPVKNMPKPSEKKPKEDTKDKTNHSLMFKNGQTTLDKNLESQLKKEIIPFLMKNNDGRIQILSFASATDGTESSARRTSLSRALAVRDFMLGQKIPPERIDVRALANQAGATSATDRIDVVLLK